MIAVDPQRLLPAVQAGGEEEALLLERETQDEACKDDILDDFEVSDTIFNSLFKEDEGFRRFIAIATAVSESSTHASSSFHLNSSAASAAASSSSHAQLTNFSSLKREALEAGPGCASVDLLENIRRLFGSEVIDLDEELRRLQWRNRQAMAVLKLLGVLPKEHPLYAVPEESRLTQEDIRLAEERVGILHVPQIHWSVTADAPDCKAFFHSENFTHTARKLQQQALKNQRKRRSWSAHTRSSHSGRSHASHAAAHGQKGKNSSQTTTAPSPQCHHSISTTPPPGLPKDKPFWPSSPHGFHSELTGDLFVDLHSSHPCYMWRVEGPIDAPLEDVFAMVAEVQHMDKWMPRYNRPFRLALRPPNVFQDQPDSARIDSKEQGVRLALDLPWPLSSRYFDVHAFGFDGTELPDEIGPSVVVVVSPFSQESGAEGEGEKENGTGAAFRRAGNTKSRPEALEGDLEMKFCGGMSIHALPDGRAYINTVVCFDPSYNISGPFVGFVSRLVVRKAFQQFHEQCRKVKDSPHFQEAREARPRFYAYLKTLSDRLRASAASQEGTEGERVRGG